MCKYVILCIPVRQSCNYVVMHLTRYADPFMSLIILKFDGESKLHYVSLTT